MGISCVVTVTGVSDLVSEGTAALGTKVESVSAISAVGMGAFPWDADVGSVAVVDSGAEVEVAAAAQLERNSGLAGSAEHIQPTRA